MFKNDSSDCHIGYGIDKKNCLLRAIFKFKIPQISQLKKGSIYIFSGKASDSNKVGVLRLGFSISSQISCIRVSSIEVYGEKRLGHGSFAIKFLENDLIPEVNKRINRFGNLKPITFIHGCSGPLAQDTDEEARRSFYLANGYTMDGAIFRKKL